MEAFRAMCGMMSSFKKRLQTSKLALRVLLLLAILDAIVTAQYNCANAPPKVGREEKKLKTPTTSRYRVTVTQAGATKHEGQAPFDLLLPPGNYTVKVALKFSSGTLAMAQFEDGRLIWESPCVVLNDDATIPLTLLNKANTTVHLVLRDPHAKKQPTYSLVVFSIVVPPTPQIKGSAVGQPSTAPHNTDATTGATVTETPAPQLPNAATTTGADQAGTSPTGDEFSTDVHSSTDCSGRKGCVSDQPTVASHLSEQPPKIATTSSPDASASQRDTGGGAVGGAVGGVAVIVLIIALVCYFVRQHWIHKDDVADKTKQI